MAHSRTPCIHLLIVRPDAEEATDQLRSFIKDALISDDDVDEIELRYGSLWVAPWIALGGGGLILLILSRPSVDEAVFDVQQNCFWHVQRNSMWQQTHVMRQPLRAVARCLHRPHHAAQRLRLLPPGAASALAVPL